MNTSIIIVWNFFVPESCSGSLSKSILSPAEQLVAFHRVVSQLLADVQERLVYRAHIYVQNDIIGYKPVAGDLAYPEKLEMMEVHLAVLFLFKLRLYIYSLLWNIYSLSENVICALTEYCGKPADPNIASFAGALRVRIFRFVTGHCPLTHWK